MDTSARRALCASLEAGLCDIAISSGRVIATDRDRGHLAVLVTTTSCGVVAQCVLGRLRDDHGRTDFVMHSLRGHYVILHEPSGLMFDLETYQGVPADKPYRLPLWLRTVLHDNGCGPAWADRWVRQRNRALAEVGLAVLLADYRPRDALR